MVDNYQSFFNFKEIKNKDLIATLNCNANNLDNHFTHQHFQIYLHLNHQQTHVRTNLQKHR